MIGLHAEPLASRPDDPDKMADFCLDHCHSSLGVGRTRAAWFKKASRWTSLFDWKFLQEIPDPLDPGDPRFDVLWTVPSGVAKPTSCLEFLDEIPFPRVTPEANPTQQQAPHYCSSAHFLSVGDPETPSDPPKLLRVVSIGHPGFGRSFPEEVGVKKVYEQRGVALGTKVQASCDLLDTIFDMNSPGDNTREEMARQRALPRHNPVFMLGIAGEVAKHLENDETLPVLRYLASIPVGQRDRCRTKEEVMAWLASSESPPGTPHDPEKIAGVLRDGGQLQGAPRPHFHWWRWRGISKAYKKCLVEEFGLPDATPIDNKFDAYLDRLIGSPDDNLPDDGDHPDNWGSSGLDIIRP